MLIRQKSSDLAFWWQSLADCERKNNDHSLSTLKAINGINHQPITKAFCQAQDMMANRRDLCSKRRNHANGLRRYPRRQQEFKRFADHLRFHQTQLWANCALRLQQRLSVLQLLPL